jgi:hypothetical protein
MVFNATFNTISVISWQLVLLVEERGGPRENHWPVVSHWQTLSQFGISKNLYWYSCIAIVTYCVLTKFSGEELIEHLKYKTQNSPWLDIVTSRGLKHFIFTVTIGNTILFRANQSLLLLLNTVCLAERKQIPMNCYILCTYKV